MLFFSACTENDSSEESENTSYMLQRQDITPPTATKNPKELSIHGDTRVDNYYWMNQREDPEVIKFLEAENQYTTEMMAHLSTFQDKLFEEMKGRIKEDDETVPYKNNGYFYITRFEKGNEYPIYSRKKGSLEAKEEIMLNVNELAKAYDFYNVGGRSVSPNNKLLAFGEDTLSRRIYTLKFKNLETGEMLGDVIPNTTGSAVWANDNKTLFYSVKDESLRPYKIFKHKLGTPASDDVEVYHEADETFTAYVFKTKSEKYISILSYQTLSTEFRMLDADEPDGTFKIVQPRERDLEYFVDHFEDKFYIRTNMDAKNFRLMETSVDATEKENWKEVIPNRDDVLLEGMEIFNNYLVLSERKNGITQLRVIPQEGEEHYINFGEDAYLAYTSVNYDFDTDLLRIGYQSMTTPSTTYDYNMKTKDMKLLKQQEVVGDFKPENYQSERVFAKARDGAMIPISIVYKKGFKKDGKQPLLLYGYGSYGASMDPYFSSTRLSLLDRGFGYAIAHIRGGEEMGRQWYENGKLLKKKNTFFDFIDCGEFLIAENYTGKGHLFAMGGSAGGLLMGAVVNYRPDLWKGVVAAVPFVDVITTMLDETIPLTTGEYDEWGNPNDKEYYDYIKSYSPYDNVEAKEYPAMLVTTGLHDSQVQYWEPAKWVAKMREMKVGKNPLLLHTNMEAGHGGASGRFQRLKETAREYAFVLDLAGKSEVEVKD
ncbi:MAG: oligopeptidase B [Saprospiraceae bacterium]|nr:MAG: oligopeptidase B [Saprospiraceae bacterium]